MGRLLRAPDGDHEEAVTEETKTEETKTLVNEEPVKVEETKTEEPKTEETKTEEAVVVEPLKVEDIVLPEGFTIEPERATEFLEILNGEQSPLDRANALIALHTKTLTEASEASSKAWEDTQTEWQTEAKADPDIGGAKLQSTLTNVSKLLDEFGSKELRGVFDLTGAGNNVHVIKFLNTISGKLTEGSLFQAGSPAKDDSPDAAAKRMFPSMKG